MVDVRGPLRGPGKPKRLRCPVRGDVQSAGHVELDGAQGQCRERRRAGPQRAAEARRPAP